MAGDGVAKPAARRKKRRAITESARDLGWKLRRDVELLERLTEDDRLEESRDKVLLQIHGHLAYAIETLPTLMNKLTEHDPDRGGEVA